MKLTKRLSHLVDIANKPYQVVWDCCCDHGLLGFNLLKRGQVQQVNFVDIVPSIINQLSINLQNYAHHLPEHVSWQTYCQDVAQIDLHSNIQSKSEACQQLVIISGVGGQLIAEFLEKLMQKYSGLNIDFLLSPVNHAYRLRHCIRELKLGLIDESLVTDNKRTYELLLVNPMQQRQVTLIGEQQWLLNREHHSYLLGLIKHYQRVLKSDNNQHNQNALRQYSQLLTKQYHNGFKQDADN